LDEAGSHVRRILAWTTDTSEAPVELFLVKSREPDCRPARPAQADHDAPRAVRPARSWAIVQTVRRLSTSNSHQKALATRGEGACGHEEISQRLLHAESLVTVVTDPGFSGVAPKRYGGLRETLSARSVPAAGRESPWSWSAARSRRYMARCRACRPWSALICFMVTPH